MSVNLDGVALLAFLGLGLLFSLMACVFYDSAISRHIVVIFGSIEVGFKKGSNFLAEKKAALMMSKKKKPAASNEKEKEEEAATSSSPSFVHDDEDEDPDAIRIVSTTHNNKGVDNHGFVGGSEVKMGNKWP